MTKNIFSSKAKSEVKKNPLEGFLIPSSLSPFLGVSSQEGNRISSSSMSVHRKNIKHWKRIFHGKLKYLNKTRPFPECLTSTERWIMFHALICPFGLLMSFVTFLLVSSIVLISKESLCYLTYKYPLDRWKMPPRNKFQQYNSSTNGFHLIHPRIIKKKKLAKSHS